MNKYLFIVNAFKFIIFFNLLTLSKTFNQGSWLAVRRWCHTFMCMRSINSGSKPELTEKVDDQHHGTNKAGLEWFGFVNSKLIL